MTLEQCSAAIKEILSMMKKTADEENPESTEKVRHEGDTKDEEGEYKKFVNKAEVADEDEEKEEKKEKAEDEDMSKSDGDKEKPAGMDAKSFFVQLSKRNGLVEKLSAHVGTFDHADMTLDEVAKYGVKKLRLSCKPGHEESVLNGYLAGAKTSSVASVANDSRVESSCITAYFGVPGEQYSDGPWRAQTFTINSASAAYNIIGATCCTVTSQGFVAAGNSGGTAIFAGLLVDPKNVALFGTGGIPLNPTLTVPNFTIIECATMGSFVVTLPAAAAIGDWVVYDNTTGAISTVAAGAGLPGSHSWANAFVDYFTVGGAGLAVITMNPGVGQPTQ
jgi:hypothetical protein